MPSLKDIYKQPSEVATILTTKGDLLVRNSSTVARLPVGSTGTMLVADNTADSGLKWQTIELGYSVLNSDFTVPPVGSDVTISVSNTIWMSPGQYIFIQSAGTYEITSILSNTSVTIKNLYSENATGTITLAKKIVASAKKGETGATGTSGANGADGIDGVDGADGINSYANTTNTFSVPSIGQSVTVSLTNTAWIVSGQYLYIEGAGSFYCSSKTSSTVTIQNMGSPDNSISGTTISSGSLVTTSGPPGLNGTNSILTNTTANYTQPDANSTVTVDVVASDFYQVGSYVYIDDGGFYKITSIPSTTELTILNIGDIENASPNTNITPGKKVVPSGRPGIDGVDGVNGTDGASPNYIGVFATAPTSPALNDVYRNSTDKTVYIWNGTQWLLLVTDGVDGVSGVDGIDGVDGAVGSVESGTSLNLLHQSTTPAALTDHLKLYSTTSGLFYIQPTGSSQELVTQSSLGTAAPLNVGTAIGNIVQLINSGGIPRLPAIDGSLLTNLSNSRVQNEGANLTARLSLNFVGDLVNAVDSGSSSNKITVTISSGLSTSGDLLYHNGTEIARLPRGTEGQILSASSNSINWITPTTSVTSYNDLSDKPLLGTASSLNYGTAIGNLVQLVNVAGVPKLPAVDGSQLINLPSGTGDMNKSIYDTNNSGIVDSAESISGSPSLNQYYGTNSSGIKGFYNLPNGSSGSTLSVSDGVTTVSNVEQITITGAQVSSVSGVANITVTGGNTAQVDRGLIQAMITAGITI